MGLKGVQRAPRSPLRFDTFDLLTRFVEERRVPLHAETTLDAFASAVRAEAAQAVATPTVVHGLRTQALATQPDGALAHERGLALTVGAVDEGERLEADFAPS